MRIRTIGIIVAVMVAVGGIFTAALWDCPAIRRILAAEGPVAAQPGFPMNTPISIEEAREYMLALVNEARRNSGLQPVRLGHNPAAQMHAEASIRHCTISHWDIWGLKPNHRYTLTGGTGTGTENALGRQYCAGPEHGGPYEGIARWDVQNAMTVWLDSRGHRENILHPRHTILNVGIAYDPYNHTMVQQFSSDYVTYQERPGISPEGILTMSGTVQGAALNTGDQVVIQIGYDRPPSPLTRGQLSKTYALCNPWTVGAIRAEPPRQGQALGPTPETVMQRVGCRDPYENHPAATPARNAEEALKYGEEARNTSYILRHYPVELHRITPKVREIRPRSFRVQADLGPILRSYGPGIYSITLWGTPHHMSMSTLLSEQSIFWGTSPPEDSPYTDP